MADIPTEKVRLTDQLVRNLKAAAKGKRYEVRDTDAPGLIVRVTETGTKTYMLKTRFPGSTNPTRRAIGDAKLVTLKAAREKVREWRALIGDHMDPQEVEEQRRQEEERQRDNTFAAVYADFKTYKLAKERKGDETARDIERDLRPKLGKRPIAKITDDEIAAIVKVKARTAPAQARNLLTTAKRFFQWAIDQRGYDIRTNPAAGLKPSALCGEKIARHRILTDDELFAAWRAADRLGYPHGSVYKALILAGLRLNEAADAGRNEFDWHKRLWTIPAARMKGRDGKAREHIVPLTDDLGALFESLPTRVAGHFVFSTTGGKKPVWMSNKVKAAMDARMLRTLRALARRRGEDASRVTLEPWVNHDLRRTVRSHLSRLKVAEEAREAVLAHVRPGIKGVYDKYDYLDEKREALELWAQRLRSIVEPPPANVVSIQRAHA